VAAIEFRSASVAAALALEGPEGIERVESVCDRLAASDHLLSATGEQIWPDGTRTATYAFRHQLYRQSLYENLSSSYRRRYHQRVGERLERGFATELRRVVAELAAHFDQSGDDEKALAYFTLAARQAHQRFAHREAVELLQLALPHLEQMPGGHNRDIDELQLRSGIVLALWLGELHRPEEERLQMARIRELSSALGPGEGSARLSFRLWTLYSTRSLPNLANSFADRMLEAADFASELRVEALIAKGMTALMRGQCDDGLDHLHCALESNDDPPAPDDLGRSRIDWQRIALPIHAYMMVALAFVGAFRRSLEHLRTALALSGEEVAPKHAAATQLGTAGVLYYVLGDLSAGRACSERGLALAEEHNLGYLAAVARLQLTWLAIRSGDGRDNADTVAAAWRAYLDARDATPTPFAPIFLADACRLSGLVDDGLMIVDTVWRDTRDSGLRWYDAELQRLKGDLLLVEDGRSARQQALECYERALSIARQQGCRFYELRAALSLGKLDSGSRKSRAAIRRAYAGVEAEIDTPDLVAATEMIDC
jgi:tetratricopeptide (TPR) repeat protein